VARLHFFFCQFSLPPPPVPSAILSGSSFTRRFPPIHTAWPLGLKKFGSCGMFFFGLYDLFLPFLGRRPPLFSIILYDLRVPRVRFDFGTSSFSSPNPVPGVSTSPFLFSTVFFPLALVCLPRPKFLFLCQNKVTACSLPVVNSLFSPV